MRPPMRSAGLIALATAMFVPALAQTVPRTEVEIMKAGAEMLGSISWYSAFCIPHGDNLNPIDTSDQQGREEQTKRYGNLAYVLVTMIQHQRVQAFPLTLFRRNIDLSRAENSRSAREVGKGEHCRYLVQMIDAEYDQLFDFWKQDFAAIQNAEALEATDIRGAITPQSPAPAKNTSLEMMEAGSDILGSLSWYSRECLSQSDTETLGRVRKLHQELTYILGLMIQVHNHPSFRFLIEYPARQNMTFSAHETTGRQIGKEHHCSALREELISKHPPVLAFWKKEFQAFQSGQNLDQKESRRKSDLAFREEERRRAMIMPGPSGSAEFPAYDNSPENARRLRVDNQ